MSLKKRILLLGFVISVFAIGVWVVVKISSDSGTNKQEVQLGPEEGGISVINLTNADALVGALLPKQFDVTKLAVNDYIGIIVAKSNREAGRTPENSEVKEASISEVTTSESGGVVSFTVTPIGYEELKFTASVDRYTHYDKVIFSVPSSDYQSLLEVY